jgi:hypothetical protein
MTTAQWRAEHSEEHRASSRKWARKNPEAVKAASKAYYWANRERELQRKRDEYQQRAAVLRRYKTLKGCLRCGYRTHEAALVFHHRNPALKTRTPSAFLRAGWKAVRAELAKCDVLCANCHAILHWEERCI